MSDILHSIVFPHAMLESIRLIKPDGKEIIYPVGYVHDQDTLNGIYGELRQEYSDWTTIYIHVRSKANEINF